MEREARVSLAAYRCYVSVAPGARPSALACWLQERGLEPGWSWMAFRRGVDDLLGPPTSLRLARVGRAEASAFGRVVAIGYELPDAVASWAASACDAGCSVVVTETGELRPDRPSSSYRNILRAGFTEVAVTENWLRPSRSQAA